jgi:prolyl oligopeptidase
MRNAFLVLCCSFFPTFIYAQIAYPETRKLPSTVTKHKMSYLDEYTWLEDMRSTEVNAWVDKENDLVNSHLEEIKKTYALASKIKEYDTFASC